MAFGRKARRIAELEAEVIDLRENLAVANVFTGHPGLQTAIEVRKGWWYQVSYQFMHTGGPLLDIRQLFVGNSDAGPYFDGAGQSWQGESTVENPHRAAKGEQKPVDPEPWLFISDQVFGEFRSDHDERYNSVSGTYWAFSPRPAYSQNREDYAS